MFGKTACELFREVAYTTPETLLPYNVSPYTSWPDTRIVHTAGYVSVKASFTACKFKKLSFQFFAQSFAAALGA